MVKKLLKSIVIEGIDGSGKSSFARLLKTRLEQENISVFQLSLFKNEEIRWAAQMLNARGAMTPEVLCSLHLADLKTNLGKATKRVESIVVWDRYIYSSATSIKLRGAKPSTWRIILDEFPRPDLVILLSSNAELCYERIKERGGVTFFECGLDLFYRGSRLPDAITAFNSGGICQNFQKASFINFMTDWNNSLLELTKNENRTVLTDFQLNDFENVIDGIIDSIIG